jgi:Rps23 Pro-64 3,4-dihydroxylase Tpa1-like proline 4-hydroxylase
VLHELNSGLFLRFLELLTGIKGLIGDPYFSESGFTYSSNGGFLDIHADFSHQDHTGLERRLNMILYLNDDWDDSYGGNLGLYDADVELVEYVEPIGNRCLIFETSPTSYHGFPDPIACPPDRQRRSLSMYYYSLPRAEREKQRVVFPNEPEFEWEATKT